MQGEHGCFRWLMLLLVLMLLFGLFLLVAGIYLDAVDVRSFEPSIRTMAEGWAIG